MERDDYVIVTNPKHSNYRRIGRVWCVFTKGTLAGKVLVKFGTFTNCLVAWEIELLKEYNKKNPPVKCVVPNPIMH